jgi:hypothetical protein
VILPLPFLVMCCEQEMAGVRRDSVSSGYVFFGNGSTDSDGQVAE